MDQCAAIYMSFFRRKVFNYSLKEIVLHTPSFYIAAPPHLHCVSGEKKKRKQEGLCTGSLDKYCFHVLWERVSHNQWVIRRQNALLSIHFRLQYSEMLNDCHSPLGGNEIKLKTCCACLTVCQSNSFFFFFFSTNGTLLQGKCQRAENNIKTLPSEDQASAAFNQPGHLTCWICRLTTNLMHIWHS